MVDWYHYTNPFYMKLKIPIDMKISNVEKKWGKALDVTYVDDGEKVQYIYIGMMDFTLCQKQL